MPSLKERINRIIAEKSALENEARVKEEARERETKLTAEKRLARISGLIQDSVAPYLAELNELGALRLFRDLMIIERQQRRPSFRPSGGRPSGERPVSQFFLRASLKFLCPKSDSKDFETYQSPNGRWALKEVDLNEIDLENLAIKTDSVSASFVWYNCEMVSGRDQQDIVHYPAWVKREICVHILKSSPESAWKVFCNRKEVSPLNKDSLEELIAHEYVKLDYWWGMRLDFRE